MPEDAPDWWQACLQRPDPAAAPWVDRAEAERARRRPPEDTFAWVWDDLIDDPDLAADRQRLKARMAGGVLVDLACGRAGFGLRLASALGCRAWVGVDTAFRPDGPHAVHQDLDAELPDPVPPRPPGVAVVRLAADALEVARRLRPGSVHLLLGGVDGDVVAAEGWHRALAAQLVRVATSETVVLWTESLAGPRLQTLGLPPWEGFACVTRIAQRDAAGGGRWLGTGIHRALPARGGVGASSGGEEGTAPRVDTRWHPAR